MKIKEQKPSGKPTLHILEHERTKWGTAVSVELTGDEVATAIMAYLVAHGIHVQGARTVTVNGQLCQAGRVFVDPSGFLVSGGERFPKEKS